MTIDDDDWDYSDAETGMESDPMESDDRCGPLREDMVPDEDDEIDPENLAEWEDSDGDQWRSSVDGKHILIECTDCVDGKENAFNAVCIEDMPEWLRFLVATYKAYKAIPDDVKEELRGGY